MIWPFHEKLAAPRVCLHPSILFWFEFGHDVVMKSQTVDTTRQDFSELNVKFSELNLLDFRLLAQATKVSERSLARLIDAGEGPPKIKLGRRVLFRRESVEKWLAERESAPRRRGRR